MSDMVMHVLRAWLFALCILSIISCCEQNTTFREMVEGHLLSSVRWKDLSSISVQLAIGSGPVETRRGPVRTRNEPVWTAIGPMEARNGPVGIVIRPLRAVIVPLETRCGSLRRRKGPLGTRNVPVRTGSAPFCEVSSVRYIK